MTDLRDQLQASLGDSYSIERELGGGGMSRVFVAEETRFRRRVVIKVLPPDLAAGLSVERFEREIGFTAGLQQANIVPVITAGDIGGLPWYSMPYVEGESLRARLERGCLPLNEAVHILRDVAKALAYAHERGVVHRDIKPDNVLLSGGTAVVTDFGIAKAIRVARDASTTTLATADAPLRTPASSDVLLSGETALAIDFDIAKAVLVAGDASTATLTAGGTSLGTPAYIAPEQALGKDVDARADLYSWGVVAYELLAGEHPFAGKTSAQQLVAAHIMEAPPPLARRSSPIPAWLCDVVHRALAKNPADRPSAAEEIVRALAHRLSLGAPAPELPSIAVLPFTTIGANNEDAYFAEGVTEEILNALAHVGNLRVAARASTIAARAKQLDLKSIGSQLGVRSVLDGTIRRAGRRIRVTAQLVNVADGITLWSERYDRETEDVFAIQDDIATAVVSALRVRLTGPVGEALGRRQTDDLAAYDLYLRGRHYWRQRGDGLWKGLLFFEQALRQDPYYAAALSGVADASFLLDFYGFVEPAVTTARALEAARRAVELDPMLADAQCSLGAVTSFLAWEHDDGVRALIRALELNPGHTAARMWLAVVRGEQGRPAEAVDIALEATALDPLSAMTHAILGWWLVHSRRYDEALPALDRALELSSGNFLAHYFRATAYHATGRTADAIAEFDEASRLSRRGAWALAGMAHTFATAGRVDDAKQIRAELEDRAAREYVARSHLARVNASAGDFDRALELFAGACDRLEVHAPHETYERAWDPVRRDARFAALLERVGVRAGVPA